MNPIYSELKLDFLLRTASFEKHWLCFCSFISHLRLKVIKNAFASTKECTLENIALMK